MESMGKISNFQYHPSFFWLDTEQNTTSLIMLICIIQNKQKIYMCDKYITWLEKTKRKKYQTEYTY
jgi:hypothetical protein